MKKSLLVFAAMAASVSLFAQVKVNSIAEFYTMKISTDGRYIISSADGPMQVLNVETGKIESYPEVMPGNGNCISTSGIVVGSNQMDAPMMIVDNKLVYPENLTKFSLCDLHGITPDGTRACGLVNSPEGNTDGQMYQPMVVNVNADGSVSDPIYLPHPEKDFFGNTPQHCSAVRIGPDGKTVVGQVIDDSGFFIYPIVYKEDADGKWSYTLPSEPYFNPNHIEIPENPGEFEEPRPEAKDFISEEKRTEYEAAYKEWEDAGYPEGLEPNVASYMTEEEIAAYNKAAEEYNMRLEEYYKKFEEYTEARDKVIDESLSFVLNALALDTAGKKLAIGAVKYVMTEGAFMPEEIYSTCVFDLENNTMNQIEGKYTNILPSQVLANGEVLGCTPVPGPWSTSLLPPLTYIYTPGATDYVPIQEYLEGVAPEAITWMNENLPKEIPVDMDEEYNPIYEEVLMTGHAVASDDMSVISGGVLAYMYDENMSFVSYVITGSTNAVADVAAEASSLRVLKGGVLVAHGVVADVEVYTMAGAQVYSAATLQGSVNTGIAAGIYAIAWTDAAGERHSAKVLF